VRQQFRPEFINRIDEFIVFQALDRLQIAQIVRLQVPLDPCYNSEGSICVASLPLAKTPLARCLARIVQLTQHHGQPAPAIHFCGDSIHTFGRLDLCCRCAMHVR